MSPGKQPGSSGARNISDNLSDLRAQVAANQKVSSRVVLKYYICSHYSTSVYYNTCRELSW